MLSTRACSLISLFVLLLGVFWCGVTFRLPEPRRDVAGVTIRQFQTLDKESRVVIAGLLRFSILSMKWKDEELEVTCSSQLLNNDGSSGKVWGFLHLWSVFYGLFWDFEGNEIACKPRINYLHNIEFVNRTTNQEIQVFSIRVPPEGKYIAVQYGTRREHTHGVLIPEKSRTNDSIKNGENRKWTRKGIRKPKSQVPFFQPLHQSSFLSVYWRTTP